MCEHLFVSHSLTVSLQSVFQTTWVNPLFPFPLSVDICFIYNTIWFLLSHTYFVWDFFLPHILAVFKNLHTVKYSLWIILWLLINALSPVSTITVPYGGFPSFHLQSCSLFEIQYWSYVPSFFLNQSYYKFVLFIDFFPSYFFINFSISISCLNFCSYL